MSWLTALPNVLTASRLAAAPILLLLAFQGAATPFLVLLAYALLSDVLDGPIARAWGQASDRGAALDSWADVGLFVAVPGGVLLLTPQLLGDETAMVAAVVGAYAIPIAVGFRKYGRLTSYHTTAARLSGAMLAAAVFPLVAAGVTWPARVAAVAVVLSASEEIAMTYVLENWRANVPSLRAALRLRRGDARPAES